MNDHKNKPLTLHVNGVDVTLNTTLITSIFGAVCWQLQHIANADELLLALCQLPSYELRRKIADSSYLSKECTDILANEDDQQVLLNLVNNSIACKYLGRSQVEKMMQTSACIAEAVAEQSDHLWQFDGNELLNELAEHPVPSVRLAVADNYHTPLSVLEKLLNDSDSAVAIKAQESYESQSRIVERDK